MEKRPRLPLLLGSHRPSAGAGVLAVVAGVAAATAAIYPLRHIAPVESLGVVYLPAVVVVSMFWGLGFGVASAVASAGAFSFFHLPPAGHLALTDGRDWTGLAAFVVVAVATGLIAEVARSRAEEAEQRRRESDLAAELARVLLGAMRLEDALPMAARWIAEALGVEEASIVLGEDGAGDPRLEVPLGDERGRIGSLRLSAPLEGQEREWLIARVIPSLVSVLVAALDRDALAAEVVETKALRRSDEMKTAVLRSVSHDLRTPVTAILTAAATLDPLRSTPENVREVRELVTDAGTRLSRLIEKLLDLSVLQAGTLEPREDLLLARGGPPRGDRAHRRTRRLPAERGPRPAAAARRPRPARAGVRERARERRPLPRRGARVGARACGRAARSGAHRRPGPRPAAGRARAHLPALLPRHADLRAPRLRARPLDREGLRGDQRRPHLGRVGRLPGDELRRRAAPPNRGAGRRRDRRAPHDRRGVRMAFERVLVCDDDAQIRRALRLVLEEAGYEVVMTSSGEEALARAALVGPHAAIVDLMLPDLHGIEVCRQLRGWSEMPILVLSALHEEATKIEALRSGADDYVTKPFGPGELVARVQAALRRAGRDVAEPQIEVEGLLIDLAGHAVWLDGREVRVTPIEFSLLRVLAANRGLLMTHSQLLTEVWGLEHADATPLLRTHIANLRRKLQTDDGRRPFIRTDSGIGYRFLA